MNDKLNWGKNLFHHNARLNALAGKNKLYFDLYCSKVCAFIITEGKTDTETHPQRQKKKIGKKSPLDLLEMASANKYLNKSLDKCFLIATIWDVG